MKKQLLPEIKEYFRITLLQTRENHITQEQMAALLGISARAYQKLENGKSCCSLFTFCMFLLYVCKDRHTFLSGFIALLDEIDKKQKTGFA